MTVRLEAQQTALVKARELSAIGELCTSVAHGLRNPLAAMRGCAQADMLDGATPEQLGVILRDLMRQVDRMEERVTRLFEFSRWQELRPERATFHQVALTAQAHVGPLLQERDVRLTIDDRSGDMVANLDRDEVADALAELITNAVHHSAAGSEVILRAEPMPPSDAPPSDGRRRGLQIQVIDRGRGMVPAECRKAFNLFFSRRPDGAGMGLAIVRRTIEGHGGEAMLASEVGSGTTVTIRLPEGEDSLGDGGGWTESYRHPD